VKKDKLAINLRESLIFVGVVTKFCEVIKGISPYTGVLHSPIPRQIRLAPNNQSPEKSGFLSIC
jgi:hypothetical protein